MKTVSEIIAEPVNLSTTIIIYEDQPLFHHMPQHSDCDVLRDGMTIRQAFAALRSIDFGDIGGMHSIECSDGSTISVDLEPTAGGQLMKSQRICHEWTFRGEVESRRYYSL